MGKIGKEDKPEKKGSSRDEDKMGKRGEEDL